MPNTTALNQNIRNVSYGKKTYVKTTACFSHLSVNSLLFGSLKCTYGTLDNTIFLFKANKTSN